MTSDLRSSSAIRRPSRQKILRVNESLGGISRLTFQMSVAALPHAKMLRAIELLGTRVAPLVRAALASEKVAAPLLKNAPVAALKTN